MATITALAEPEVLATGTSTTVSGTLVDINNTVWAGATVVARFFQTPNLPGPFYWGDEPNFQRIFQTSADTNGHFSLSLPDNTTINPQGSLWEFVIAPAATVQAVVFRLMIAGTAMDIGSVFTAQSTQLDNMLIQSFPMPRAYQDSEVAQPPNAGQLYYDSTNHQLKMWTSGGWHPILGGGFTTVPDNTSPNGLGTGIYHTAGGFGAPIPVAGPLAANSVLVVLGTLQFLYAGNDQFNRLWSRQFRYDIPGYTDWGAMNVTHVIIGTADPGAFNHTGTWIVSGGFSANGPAVSDSRNASVEVVLGDFGDPTLLTITQRCICPYDANPTKQWIRFFNLNNNGLWGAWA